MTRESNLVGSALLGLILFLFLFSTFLLSFLYRIYSNVASLSAVPSGTDRNAE